MGKSRNDSESSDDDVLVNDNTGETLNFEFEAYPIGEESVVGINNLLTQIFINNNFINIEELAVHISKSCRDYGHVVQLVEDAVTDEEDGEMVFAFSTILNISNEEDINKKLKDFIRSKLTSKGCLVQQEIKEKFLNLLKNKENNLALYFNERWLNMPQQLAVSSLQNLIAETDKIRTFKDIFLISFLKIYINENDGGKKGDLNVIYANTEEKYIFDVVKEYPYFDYPVYSEIESDSKFASKVVDGKLYKPYRRVISFPYSVIHDLVPVIQIQ
uniref:BRCA2 and CDKN1A-interacting protein (inferred by orthology to a human protein) n=1 Tax=Strongyloides venezuelensis TaxID=75913 RepID=A0A0K0FLB8_STRVS